MRRVCLVEVRGIPLGTGFLVGPAAAPDGSPPGVWIKAATLYRLHAESVIEPGDRLELPIDMAADQSHGPAIKLVGNFVVLDMSITDRPVTPPPQAALRRFWVQSQLDYFTKAG